MKLEMCLFGCLTATLLWAAEQGPEEMAPNGGFEGEYRQGLAPGWEANCYGENEYRFEAETENPHSGQAAQAAVCTRFVRGGVQFRCRGIAIEKGKPYTLTVWMRGTLTSPVYVGIRKHGAPYTRYLVRFVRVGPEWRRYTILGEVPETDAECGIYFRFASTGRLVVDDLSLRPGRHPPQTPAIEAPPVKGNRLYNGSFELGGADWVPLGEGLEARAENPVHGKFAARRHLEHPGLLVESRPLTLRAGQVHTFSLWLRREEGPAEVTLELVEYADAGGDQPTARAGLRRTVPVTAKWQRVAVTGVLEAPFTHGHLARVVAKVPGTYWLDAAQVEEGELSPFAPAYPIEVAASVPLRQRYLAPGKAAPVRVRVAAINPFSGSLRLTFRLFDLWEREVARHTTTVEAAGRTHVEYTASVTPPDRGLYRVQVEAEGAGAGVGEALVGVLPPLSAVPPDERGFLGNHAPASLDPASPNIGPQAARRAGARWYRIHDFANYVQWHWVEPEPGQFRWYDAEIGLLRRMGFALLGTLCRPPLWAGRPGEEHRRYGDWTSSPPRSLEEFANYVRRTVEHYRHHIRVWEIWNEPYGAGFFSGTPEEYAEVLKVGYRACKEVDPECTVLGLCAYPGLPEWIERVLRVVGTDYFDVLSYHTYFTPGQVREPEGGGDPPLVQDVQRMQELMREYGEEKPIWHTEGGVACPTFYSWLPPNGWRWDVRTAAATVTKCVTLLKSAGVEKWFYYYVGYAWGGRGNYYTLLNTPYIQIDFDGSPKATLLAQAAAATFLDGAQFREKVTAGPLRAYIFAREGDTVAVVWREGAGTGPKLRRPREVHLYDLMGAERAAEEGWMLTAEPVYLVGPEWAVQRLRHSA
ncbi:MAG TPA: hypothetical protein EYP85_05760 [Armatimonadetes bacterium]|nr:hypothetical protein [Armatimonadota bacterium]